MPIRSRFSSKRLEKDVNELLKRIDRRSVKVARRVAVDLRYRLARKNPKKTGRSAASWNLSLNRGILAHKPYGYDNKRGSVGDAIVRIEGAKAGDKFVITNTIPYLNLLEHGHSSKAPEGFIANTIALVTARLRAGAYSGK
jgi:hypothetical protein